MALFVSLLVLWMAAAATTVASALSPYCTSVNITTTTTGISTGGSTTTLLSDSDGIGSSPYSPNENCSWSVRCEDSAAYLGFVLQQRIAPKDYVQFVYGDDNGNLIHTVNFSVSTTTTSLLMYPTNSAVVRFRTQQSIFYGGFTLELQCRGIGFSYSNAFEDTQVFIPAVKHVGIVCIGLGPHFIIAKGTLTFQLESESSSVTLNGCVVLGSIAFVGEGSACMANSEVLGIESNSVPTRFLVECVSAMICNFTNITVNGGMAGGISIKPSTRGGWGYLTDSDISHCRVRGGAQAAQAYITGVRVMNCSSDETGGGIEASGKSVIQNSYVYGCTSAQGGGGIMATTSAVINVTVLHCTSPVGGGVAAGLSSTLTDVTVLYCQSMVFGGGVYLSSSQAFNIIVMHSTASLMGGGIYADTLQRLSNVWVANCTSSQGGGLFLQNVMMLQNATVFLCKAIHGGGIFGSSSHMVNVSVSSCSASYGGGIFGNLSVVDQVQVHNSNSSSVGGGICVYDGLLTNAFISFCTALFVGGGLSTSDSTIINLTVRNCVTTAGGGGGIYARNAVMTFVTVTNCSSQFGGGVVVRNSNLSFATIRNSFAEYRGGCLTVDLGDQDVFIANVDLENCTSPHGGLMSIGVDDDTFSVKIKISNSTFSSGISNSHGGCVFMLGGAKQSTLIVDTCAFSKCKSQMGSGGAMFLARTNIVLLSVNVTQSQSLTFGGLISIVQTSKVEMYRTILQGGRAYGGGGCISIHEGGLVAGTQLRIDDNSIVDGCTAGVGGFMYYSFSSVVSAQIELSRCQVNLISFLGSLRLGGDFIFFEYKDVNQTFTISVILLSSIKVIECIQTADTVVNKDDYPRMHHVGLIAACGTSGVAVLHRYPAEITHNNSKEPNPIPSPPETTNDTRIHNDDHSRYFVFRQSSNVMPFFWKSFVTKSVRTSPEQYQRFVLRKMPKPSTSSLLLESFGVIRSIYSIVSASEGIPVLVFETSSKGRAVYTFTGVPVKLSSIPGTLTFDCNKKTDPLGALSFINFNSTSSWSWFTKIWWRDEITSSATVCRCRHQSPKTKIMEPYVCEMVNVTQGIQTSSVLSEEWLDTFSRSSLIWRKRTAKNTNVLSLYSLMWYNTSYHVVDEWSQSQVDPMFAPDEAVLGCPKGTLGYTNWGVCYSGGIDPTNYQSDGAESKSLPNHSTGKTLHDVIPGIIPLLQGQRPLAIIPVDTKTLVFVGTRYYEYDHTTSTFSVAYPVGVMFPEQGLPAVMTLTSHQPNNIPQYSAIEFFLELLDDTFSVVQSGNMVVQIIAEHATPEVTKVTVDGELAQGRGYVTLSLPITGSWSLRAYHPDSGAESASAQLVVTSPRSCDNLTSDDEGCLVSCAGGRDCVVDVPSKGTWVVDVSYSGPVDWYFQTWSFDEEAVGFQLKNCSWNGIWDIESNQCICNLNRDFGYWTVSSGCSECVDGYRGPWCNETTTATLSTTYSSAIEFELRLIPPESEMSVEIVCPSEMNGDIDVDVHFVAADACGVSASCSGHGTCILTHNTQHITNSSFTLLTPVSVCQCDPGYIGRVCEQVNSTLFQQHCIDDDINGHWVRSSDEVDVSDQTWKAEVIASSSSTGLPSLFRVYYPEQYNYFQETLVSSALLRLPMPRIHETGFGRITPQTIPVAWTQQLTVGYNAWLELDPLPGTPIHIFSTIRGNSTSSVIHNIGMFQEGGLLVFNVTSILSAVAQTTSSLTVRSNKYFFEISLFENEPSESKYLPQCSLRVVTAPADVSKTNRRTYYAYPIPALSGQHRFPRPTSMITDDTTHVVYMVNTVPLPTLMKDPSLVVDEASVPLELYEWYGGKLEPRRITYFTTTTFTDPCISSLCLYKGWLYFMAKESEFGMSLLYVYDPVTKMYSHVGTTPQLYAPAHLRSITLKSQQYIALLASTSGFVLFPKPYRELVSYPQSELLDTVAEFGIYLISRDENLVHSVRVVLPDQPVAPSGFLNLGFDVTSLDPKIPFHPFPIPSPDFLVNENQTVLYFQFPEFPYAPGGPLDVVNTSYTNLIQYFPFRWLCVWHHYSLDMERALNTSNMDGIFPYPYLSELLDDNIMRYFITIGGCSQCDYPNLPGVLTMPTQSTWTTKSEILHRCLSEHGSVAICSLNVHSMRSHVLVTGKRIFTFVGLSIPYFVDICSMFEISKELLLAVACMTPRDITAKASTFDKEFLIYFMMSNLDWTAFVGNQFHFFIVNRTTIRFQDPYVVDFDKPDLESVEFLFSTFRMNGTVPRPVWLIQGETQQMSIVDASHVPTSYESFDIVSSYQLAFHLDAVALMDSAFTPLANNNTLSVLNPCNLCAPGFHGIKCTLQTSSATSSSTRLQRNNVDTHLSDLTLPSAVFMDRTKRSNKTLRVVGDSHSNWAIVRVHTLQQNMNNYSTLCSVTVTSPAYSSYESHGWCSDDLMRGHWGPWPQCDTCRWPWKGRVCDEYAFPQPCNVSWCKGACVPSSIDGQQYAMCLCPKGYVGVHCTIPCDETTNCTSPSQGRCEEDGSGCRCSDRFEGTRCDKCRSGLWNYPLCDRNTSLRCVHGTMNDVNGVCQCWGPQYTGGVCDECSSGWFGAHCEIPCASSQCGQSSTCDVYRGSCQGCVPNVTCSGHGTCRSNVYSLMKLTPCVCDSNWDGDSACNTCSHMYYGVNCLHPCQCNHGYCDGRRDGTMVCVCTDEYEGTRCDVTRTRKYKLGDFVPLTILRQVTTKDIVQESMMIRQESSTVVVTNSTVVYGRRSIYIESKVAQQQQPIDNTFVIRGFLVVEAQHRVLVVVDPIEYSIGKTIIVKSYSIAPFTQFEAVTLLGDKVISTASLLDSSSNRSVLFVLSFSLWQQVPYIECVQITNNMTKSKSLILRDLKLASSLVVYSGRSNNMILVFGQDSENNPLVCVATYDSSNALTLNGCVDFFPSTCSAKNYVYNPNDVANRCVNILRSMQVFDSIVAVVEFRTSSQAVIADVMLVSFDPMNLKDFSTASKAIVSIPWNTSSSSLTCPFLGFDDLSQSVYVAINPNTVFKLPYPFLAEQDHFSKPLMAVLPNVRTIYGGGMDTMTNRVAFFHVRLENSSSSDDEDIVFLAMYVVHAVNPTVIDNRGGTIITVLGEGFTNTTKLHGMILEAEGETPMASTYVSASTILCLANRVETYTPLLTYPLEVSLLDLSRFTESNKHVRRIDTPLVTGVEPKRSTVFTTVNLIVSGSGFFFTDYLSCKLGTVVVKGTVISSSKIACLKNASVIPSGNIKVSVSLDGQAYTFDVAHIVTSPLGSIRLTGSTSMIYAATPLLKIENITVSGYDDNGNTIDFPGGAQAESGGFNLTLFYPNNTQAVLLADQHLVNGSWSSEILKVPLVLPHLVVGQYLLSAMYVNRWMNSTSTLPITVVTGAPHHYVLWDGTPCIKDVDMKNSNCSVLIDNTLSTSTSFRFLVFDENGNSVFENSQYHMVWSVTGDVNKSTVRIEDACAIRPFSTSQFTLMEGYVTFEFNIRIFYGVLCNLTFSDLSGTRYVISLKARPCSRLSEYAPDYRIQYEPSTISNWVSCDNINILPKCGQNYFCYPRKEGMSSNGTHITLTTPGFFREPKTYESKFCRMAGCIGNRYVSPVDSDYATQCSVGYEGPLCGVCAKGYARNKDQCVPCKSFIVSIIVLVTGGLFLITCFAIFIYTSVNRAGRIRSPSSERVSVLIKMLLNHLQLISLCSGFSIQWRPMIQGMFDAFQEASSPSGEFILVGCVTPSYGAYNRFLFWVLLPMIAVAIPCVGIAVRTFQSWVKSNQQEHEQTLLVEDAINEWYSSTDEEDRCHSPYHVMYDWGSRSERTGWWEFEDCKKCRNCCIVERIFPRDPSGIPHKCTMAGHTLCIESILVWFRGSMKRALVEAYLHQQNPIVYPTPGMGLPLTTDELKMLSDGGERISMLYRMINKVCREDDEAGELKSPKETNITKDTALFYCDYCQEDFAVFTCKDCFQLLCPACNKHCHRNVKSSAHSVVEASTMFLVQRDKERSKFQQYVIIVLYLLYPTLMREIAQIMNCTEQDVCLGDPEKEPCYSYLLSDLTVACTGAQYTLYFYLSLSFFIFYGLSIPLLGTIALIWNKHLLHTEHVLAMFGPMYRGYRKKRFYWEIVTMVRKTTVVILIVFASKRPQLQTHAAIVASLVFLGLTVFMKPWKYESLWKIDMMSLLGTIVTYNCSLLLLEPESSVSEFVKDISSAVIVVVNCGIVLVFVRFILINGRRVVIEQVDYDGSGTVELSEMWQYLRQRFTTSLQSVGKALGFMSSSKSSSAVELQRNTAFTRKLLAAKHKRKKVRHRDVFNTFSSQHSREVDASLEHHMSIEMVNLEERLVEGDNAEKEESRPLPPPPPIKRVYEI